MMRWLVKVRARIVNTSAADGDHPRSAVRTKRQGGTRQLKIKKVKLKNRGEAIKPQRHRDTEEENDKKKLKLEKLKTEIKKPELVNHKGTKTQRERGFYHRFHGFHGSTNSKLKRGATRLGWAPARQARMRRNGAGNGFARRDAARTRRRDARATGWLRGKLRA